MAVAVMKHMASKFSKLDKLEEVNFKRWQKKMHFLFFSTSVVYVLTTPILKDGGDDATVKQIRKSAKWDNDDYVCTGLILNDEAIQVSCIIDKLSPSWKDLKHTLKHLKEELTLVELGSHLRIEESLKVQDNDKLKGNNVVGPLVVNMMEHNNSFRYNDNKCECKHHDNGLILTRRLNLLVGNVVKLVTLKGIAKVLMLATKPMVQTQQDDDVAWRVDSGATIHVCKDRYLKFSSGKIILLFNILHVPNIRKNLVSSSVLNNCGYKQVIESNKFVLSKHAFMSTSKLNDSILWHARLGHVHFKRMQDMFKDGLIITFDMDIEKDDPKTFDEAMKSQNVSFWKKAINDEIDFIMGNNTWVLADLLPGCKLLGCKWIFKRKSKVDATIEKFKARLTRGEHRSKTRPDQTGPNWYGPGRSGPVRSSMDVKTIFFNGELEKEAPEQWHQKFNEVVLSNGYLLNQANKCVYSKFDETGKGVIICLYVDDMIFDTDQVHVDMQRNFYNILKPIFKLALNDDGDGVIGRL
uniref:GAG-pre-integrase domain-containing protein n=1 Tax=Tanacetum cinerariifolium TaxID=118510 RepID=A0A6L2N060_TANCI|nr:hypothetical protein [Tanacetum cinerariifolium]